MDNIRNRAVEIWGQLAPWQRFAGIATAISGIGMIFLFGLWMREPSYALLYQGLDENDAAAVVNELDASRIPYRLLADGTAIEVPTGLVADARLKLAAKNLPKGGVVGFELFDQGGLSGIGMTEQMQKINIQRALEGELSRTITAIDGIEAARVHIVIPDDSLFVEDQKQPTASVMFKPTPGTRLTASQVQSIRYLLASSVEGLDPSNVSIVDVEGKMYDAPDTSDDAGIMTVSNNQIQIQRTYEIETEDKLQTMLDRTLGPQNAIVRVTVEMNWDREQSTLETVAPAGEVGSVVRSTQQKQESWKGAPADAAAGTPGVDANAPDLPTYQAGTSSTGEYSNQESTVNYEVSKEVKNIERQPGRIERISVAVLLNDTLPEDQIDKVKALMETAVGFNSERGDQVTVQRIPFNEDFLTQEAARLDDMAQRDFYVRIGTIAALLLALGGILFFIRKIFSDMQQRMMPYVIQPNTPELPDGQAKNSLQHNATNAYLQAEDPDLNDEDIDEWLKLPSPDQAEMRLRAISRRNPELVATILKNWAAEKKQEAEVAQETI
jgi:flagellar M-ring protein FliF